MRILLLSMPDTAQFTDFVTRLPNLAIIPLAGEELVCQIAPPYFRFLQGFLGLFAFGDIGYGDTAPLPAFGSRRQNSLLKTF